VRGHTCQFGGFATSGGAVLFSVENHGAPIKAGLDYIRPYHTVGPRLPLLHERAAGDWLYDEDVFDADIVVTNAYYRDLLRPYGGRYSTGAKLFVPDGAAMRIGFMSDLGDLGITPQRRAVLQVIAFHLCQATAICRQTRKRSSAAFDGTGLLQHMPQPAVLPGLEREPTFMNRQAQEYLAQGKSLLFASDRRAFDKAAESPGSSHACHCARDRRGPRCRAPGRALAKPQ